MRRRNFISQISRHGGASGRVRTAPWTPSGCLVRALAVVVVAITCGASRLSPLALRIPRQIIKTGDSSVEESLDEDGQVEFKGKAKTFVRTYGFLSSVLRYSNASWEKLSIFLNFLIPKLPTPKEEDLARGLLETIDMDSYRVEKRAAKRIALADENAEIGPVPTSGGGRRPEPELDRLSSILQTFNEQFGDINWQDKDRVRRLITEDIPAKVAADKAGNTQKNNDRQKARIEHDKALVRVMYGVMKDDTELFKQFSDDPMFRRRLAELVFEQTYEQLERERAGAA
jgi:type I restriction enzyme R subunit